MIILAHVPNGHVRHGRLIRAMKEEFPQTAAPAPGNRPSRPPAGEAPARPLPLEPWEGSAILLVDLDAFFASVEQLDHPAWRGKPVIVGGDADKHGVVSTASYEARPYGVRSAMPSSTARRLCPDAIWTHGRFDRYREVSNAIMAILRSETPHVQQVSIDEAFLDVTPTVVNREHPVRVAQRIQRRVEELGVTCSIGAGTSKTIAKIASDMDKPRGLTVVYPGSERDFLAPLPVRVMSGIGASAEEKLKSRGIRTLGQLADADLRMLERVFGKLGRVMHVRANGGDDAPVEAGRCREVGVQRDDVRDGSDPPRGRGGRHRHDGGEGGPPPSPQGPARPHARAAREVRRPAACARCSANCRARAMTSWPYTPLLYAMVDEVWRPGTPLRLIGVGMSGFSEEGVVQESLFDVAEAAPSADDVEPVVRDERKRRGLIEATDLVKDRFGEAAVRFGHELRNEENTTGSSSKNPADYK